MQHSVQVHGRQFAILIESEKIQQRVAELAARISEDYYGLNPLFIGILNGAFMFAADLFRKLSIPAEISFIKLTSYEGTSSTGNVITAIGLDEKVDGRHIIIVEDIIDTGKTLHEFMPQLMACNPASVKIAAFLTKPAALLHAIRADYTGFEIGNEFVAGYGLDYNQAGRHLPHLYVLDKQ